ncbi:facilitated trehalose transporter Tret1-like [Euwallacea similis]|uniref:facilitated trehalose transporter Tret1-like n=1 Tax=Euwallacea similis TaxID=1736056 RepID=UPI00344BE977
MSQSNFGKPLNGQDVSISLDINTDKRNLTDQKDDTGVVYRPTTLDNHGKWKESFQSLKPEKQVVPGDTFFLYRTAFLGNLLAFAGGIGFSWSSPVLPKLQSTDTPLNSQIDASQASLIASILCVGAAIGPFLFGFSADKIGRKKTLIAISLPMTAGIIFLAFTDKVEIYYLGRLLYGMGTGGVFTVLTMYTGEITSDFNRGKFSCILGIFVALGVLYPFAIGSFMTVKIFCLSCLLPLQIFLIFFTLYAPDSPSYLVRNSHYKQAERALINLRSISCEQAQKDVIELQKIEEHQRHLKGGIMELFRSRGTRKAFIIASGLLILQQISGINAVTGFMENIFMATGSSIPPQIATMMVGTIQVITVGVTSVVVEKLGRKLLLLASTLGASVSVILLGAYFFLQRHQFAMLVYFWWLPIACLLLYIVSFNLGLGPVPWTVLSEVFPDNVKSIASALASATCFGVSFLVTLAFPIVSETLGMAESFWVFGVCCAFGAIFIKLVMIETKGKNVTEIQEILSK